jgi:hypothetical protein
MHCFQPWVRIVLCGVGDNNDVVGPIPTLWVCITVLQPTHNLLWGQSILADRCWCCLPRVKQIGAQSRRCHPGNPEAGFFVPVLCEAQYRYVSKLMDCKLQVHFTLLLM